MPDGVIGAMLGVINSSAASGERGGRRSRPSFASVAVAR